MSIDAEIKWNKIYAAKELTNLQASQILIEHDFLLPQTGIALDLACGLGANAVLLAAKGLETHAYDISTVALEKLHNYATKKRLAIVGKQYDFTIDSLPKNSFDVIVVSRFLQRNLCNEIMAALKIGGLLFYQTFTQDKLNSAPPNNPDFLLSSNELLTLFQPLKTLYYQEYGLAGDVTYGNRNEAFFIGQQLNSTLSE